ACLSASKWNKLVQVEEVLGLAYGAVDRDRAALVGEAAKVVEHREDRGQAGPGGAEHPVALVVEVEHEKAHGPGELDLGAEREAAKILAGQPIRGELDR